MKSKLILFLLIFFLLSSISFLISLPHQGTQVKALIQNSGIGSDSPIAFVGNLHAGSKIRMSLGPKFNLIDLPKSGWENEISQFQNLIIEDKFFDSLDTSGYEVSQASVNWDSKEIPALLKRFGSAEFDSLVEQTGKKYYFLSKKQFNKLP